MEAARQRIPRGEFSGHKTAFGETANLFAADFRERPTRVAACWPAFADLAFPANSHSS